MDFYKTQNDINFAEKQFKKFENKITDISDLLLWLEQFEVLYKSVKYIILEHPFVSSFIAIYTSVTNIKLLVDYLPKAENAIAEFKEIEKLNKSGVKDWLNKYKENELLIPFGYDETTNWEKTKLILFKNSPDVFNENHTIFENIIIDITNFENSIRFREIYEQNSYILDEIEMNANEKITTGNNVYSS